jgi:hypothetical protein
MIWRSNWAASREVEAGSPSLPNSETVRPYSRPELRDRQVVFRAETLFQLQRSLFLQDKPCDDADHKSNQESGNNDGVGGDRGH